MKYENENRIVMTLDAGGTNFVFSAIRANKELVTPKSVAVPHNKLSVLLRLIIEGFRSVTKELPEKPAAISFGFPGPIDAPKGIIGDLENIPCFRGGVALGSMLAAEFGIPVFINNDADLFAYGEAIGGLLPAINSKLRKENSEKRYGNLLGVTLGTGFGGGFVQEGSLLKGDNSAPAEINRMRNVIYPNCSVEESVSIRGIQRVYQRESKFGDRRDISPKKIYEIGMGNRAGDKEAAKVAFDEFAIAAADALANASTLLDGLIVIGGGISGAYKLFLPKLVSEMNSKFQKMDGGNLNRLEIEVFNLESSDHRKNFFKGNPKQIKIPFSEKTVAYDPKKRIGIGVSKLGTGPAVALGAYAFALNKLAKIEK